MSASDTGSRRSDTPPRLVKAQSVSGAHLVLRNAVAADAAFILSLRLDPLKRRFLAPTSPELADQAEWLRRYAERSDEAYFIICDRNANPLGCVRLYDPIGTSYCWGSWLTVSGLSPLVSIESSLLVYAYGRWLGFDEARLDVRRANEPVWRFHERFAGAVRVGETELDYYYVMPVEKIEPLLARYRHLITDPLAVTRLEE